MAVTKGQLKNTITSINDVNFQVDVILSTLKVLPTEVRDSLLRKIDIEYRGKSYFHVINLLNGDTKVFSSIKEVHDYLSTKYTLAQSSVYAAVREGFTLKNHKITKITREDDE